MTRAFEEHWLSAYLDDELSAEDRALVDQRLEEDSSARELLEDLKRVRGLVSTLPRWHGKEFEFDPAALATFGSRATNANDQVSPEREVSGSGGLAQDITHAHAATGQIGSQPAAAQRYYWSGLLALAAGITALFFAGPYIRRAAENRELARGPDTKAIPRAAPARSLDMNENFPEDRSERDPPRPGPQAAARVPSEFFRQQPLATDFETAQSLGSNYVLAYSNDWEPSEVELALKQIASESPEDSAGLQRSMGSRPGNSDQADAEYKDASAGGAASGNKTFGNQVVVASLPDDQAPEAWLLRFRKVQPLKTWSRELAPLKQQTDSRGATLMQEPEAAADKVTSDAAKALVLFVSRQQAERMLETLKSGRESTSAARRAEDRAAEVEPDVELRAVPIAQEPVEAQKATSLADETRPEDKIILILRAGN